MKKRTILILLSVLAVLLAAGAGGYYVLFIRPCHEAVTTIPQSGVKLLEDENGGLTLSWPRAENASDYVVELKNGKSTVWSGTFTENQCALPSLSGLEGGATLTVTPRRAYQVPGGVKMRSCDKPLRAAFPAALPSFSDLKSVLDADADVLTVTWTPVDGAVYTVSSADGTELFSTTGGEASLTFGTDIPMPAKEETVTFLLTYALPGGEVDFSSRVSARVDVAGEDLRGTKLLLQVEDLGNNYYRFTWNETRGQRYELQTEDPLGQWQTLEVRTDAEALSCTLGPFAPFTDQFFRVIAVGGHTLPDSEFAAEPAEVSLFTGPTAMYATVWVQKDLDIWSDTARTARVGRATTDKSYCVMGERDGYFLIYTDGAKGYVDSAWCLINLPDYMGDFVSYDIKNSYDAVYMVHDYGIPGITNTVIPGYEQVGSDYYTVTEERTVRPETGETEPDYEELRELYTTGQTEVRKPANFLVPLLYPTAKKIVQAALLAREDGYRLKIYDAYRPYAATRFLYDLTESLIQTEVPDEVYSRMAGDKWADYLAWLARPVEEPIGDAGTGQEGSGTETETALETAEPRPTFYTVMTDGRYGIGSFLARTGSTHNQGVAVDLTLEKIYTGQELEMQTAIHDLSWYSVLNNNNENANLLQKYMTSAGLGTLFSEWWHFQDNELRKAQSIPLRQNGVTRAGWTADPNGWRYRTAENEYLKGGVYQVDGRSYTFDGDGYADYTAWEN